MSEITVNGVYVKTSQQTTSNLGLRGPQGATGPAGPVYDPLAGARIIGGHATTTLSHQTLVINGGHA